MKTPVICKVVVTPIDKHWHNKSITVTQGEIMKIIDIDKKPGFVLNKLANANGESIEPDENNTKYKMEDCELAYNTTLTKLDEKKNKKYIIKQLEKLKNVAKQIDDLDPKSNDYDFKIKSLNKMYNYIKNDINLKITPQPDSDLNPLAQEKIQNQQFEEYNQELKIESLKKQVAEATSKRLKLENILKIKQKESDPKLFGGINRIQHAGYHELKESINKVDLNSILLESKSLCKK